MSVCVRITGHLSHLSKAEATETLQNKTYCSQLGSERKILGPAVGVCISCDSPAQRTGPRGPSLKMTSAFAEGKYNLCAAKMKKAQAFISSADPAQNANHSLLFEPREIALPLYN